MLVEIYSDLICPWCYIGKHRLERALTERGRLPLERRWQPYELNPDMGPAVSTASRISRLNSAGRSGRGRSIA